MPTYTIITGTHGVGKTSFLGALMSINPDMGNLIDICCTSDYLSERIPFTQETTLSDENTIITARAARDKGYTIKLYYMGLSSFNECLKRIANRVEKGGNHIDADTVIRSFDNRFNDLLRILPYCDEAALFDNENGFVEVGEYRNGEVIVKGDYRPLWLNILIEALKA